MLPLLLYFNGPWDYLGDRIRESYIRPFQRLLEQDFNVVEVSGDCDFKEQVELHRPDVVLFHTGTESRLEKVVKIRNVHAYPDLPRMGYVFRDPFSPSRLTAMARLREWGVHQVFTAARPGDCLHDYFESSIFIPWWVDDTLMRDYGEKKTLPVTLTGSGWLSQRFYSWRQPILSALAPRLPIFHVPAQETHQSAAYVGEAYGRLLNRSLISGGCGTVNRYLTLKLLEIPACRACLLTQETAILKEMGFVDGKNCVFAEASNVAEKVEALLRNRDQLRAITEAGYELVHQRHDRLHRRMFAEWYALWCRRSPDERVVQDSPFKPLRLAPVSEKTPARRGHEDNELVQRLAQGYALIAQQRHREASSHFEWACASIPYSAEGRLGLALCHIHAGQFDPAAAHLRFSVSAQTQLVPCGPPDVISIAYLAGVLARLRQLDESVALLNLIGRFRHPALNALLWCFAQRWPNLARRSEAFRITTGDESVTVDILHPLPRLNFTGWSHYWKVLLGGRN